MTELLDLVISVKTKNWRQDDPESYAQHAEYVLMRKKVLERDQRKCRFCGFAEVAYPECHHLDDDHMNNTMENLVTACPWCHQYNHIGLAGIMGTAQMAWIPGVPPRNIHHMMRAILVCKSWAKTARSAQEQGIAKSMKNGIDALEAALNNRVTMAKQKFGTSNPVYMADALILLEKDSPEKYAKRSELLDGLIMLPTCHYYRGGKDIMDEVVASWTAPAEVNKQSGMAGEFSGISPKSWNTMLTQHLATLKNRI
jgi:intracellular multiplication protein IcmJ